MNSASAGTIQREDVLVLTQPIHTAIGSADLTRALPSPTNGYTQTVVSFCPATFSIAESLNANWPELKEQQERQYHDVIAPTLGKFPGQEIHYFGAAPIPLAVHAGFLLGSWGKITPYQQHHRTKDWAWMPSMNDDHARISTRGIPTRKKLASGPVVVRLATTCRIDPQTTREVIPEPLAEVDIVLDQFGEDVLLTINQVRDVAQAFKAAIDELCLQCPNADSVHLFAAIPVGLAFLVGAQIRPTMNPRVHTYQFSRTTTPKYTPAITLERVVNRPAIQAKGEPKEMSNPRENIWNDKYAPWQIKPWRMLKPSDYLVDAEKFGALEQQSTLRLLQHYGICQLRIHGSEATPGRLKTILEGFSILSTRQNDFEGEIKTIAPKPEVPAITGDSAKTLGMHVDGTQDEHTPSILAFQYITGAEFGGRSTFVDASRALLEIAEISEEELRAVVLPLAQPNAATFEKKGGSHTGPVIKAIGEHAIGIRARFDEVIRVEKYCEGAYKRMKDLLTRKEYILELIPVKGDIILFDNRRLMHGRTEVGGRQQRVHDRAWIADLKPEHKDELHMGIRGLLAKTIAAIQDANRSHN